MPKIPRQRFLRWVRKTASCWLWKGARRTDNAMYGAFTYKCKTYSAHIVAWNLFRGKVPEGAQVLHHCDVTHCVRPSHLFTGSQKDNMVDMLRKGRSGRAKLTPKCVRRIRRLRASGERIVDIHKEYSQVTYRQLQEILAGTSWACLT